VVEGISIIKPDPILSDVCDRIRRGQHKQALLDVLDIAPIKNRYLNHLTVNISRLLHGYLLDGIITKLLLNKPLLDSRRSDFDFPSLLWQWDWGEEGTFFEYRFTTTGFVSFFPYLAEIARRGGRTLDLCSGMGHSMFFLEKHIGSHQLYGVDIDFRKLLIGREVFSKHSNYICLDANLPLPFKSGIFSTVLCSDAFHYIDAKSTLALEIERTLDATGSLYMIHLHNALAENPCPGSPLTPERYERLFSKLKVRLVPENVIIREFLEKDRLYTAPDISDHELAHEPALHLIACNKNSIPPRCDDVWDLLLPAMNNTTLNPLFMVIDWGDQVNIRRSFPSSFFAFEQSFMSELLPEELSIPVELLEDGQFDDPRREDLIKKFVLIDVPQKYGSRRTDTRLKEARQTHEH